MMDNLVKDTTIASLNHKLQIALKRIADLEKKCTSGS